MVEIKNAKGEKREKIDQTLQPAHNKIFFVDLEVRPLICTGCIHM